MRKKIIEILITSLISALMAILQAYLTAHSGTNIPAADPLIAGVFGAGLATLKKTTA